MSPMLIAALVIGGLIILVGIGLLNQAVERARLERARAVAELQARWKHISAVADELPGQFMTIELKTLLLRIQAALLERLVRLDSKQPAHAEQLQTIRQQLDKGELRITNAPVVITDEATAQRAKQTLSDLLRVLEQSQQDGSLDGPAFHRWSQVLRQHLQQTTLTMFQAIATTALQMGKPRVAKLQYERAIAFLTKDQQSDKGQLAVFRQLLINAEQAVRQQEQGAPGATELDAGVLALEEDDQAWKKKALYDD
ncbi:hypothetical protein BN1049_02672 [Pseudomonas saudimassiliensis]|uniref:Uncharacterized protein n=1 Tax=Pseudomonas saudimassiliensis TaxID=1461581 RepID=A0A078MJ45_9PSED|nr:hypothetical protein [Pseudomonas saudimassiliensis]CEA06290.1 hypothetical protein BN1049_02672 [Pseudomonas saudimassiliensis]CEF27715.1 hypothetical protein BN1049_02672 [Pseudomonas saudimassiliensis]